VPVITTFYGGETYVHATSGHMYIPIAPAVPDEEPIFVQLRVHAVKLEKFGAGTGLDVYTRSSGGKQVGGLYINDSDLGVTGMVSADADAAGLDIVIKLNSKTEDGYGFYIRKTDSDGAWTTIAESGTYKNNSVLQVIRVGYNLAVSDVKVYTEQAPELKAVNKAADAEAMANALSTHATKFGIDLTKLDLVKNDNAVYERLLDIVFCSAEEIVTAFNSAIEAQKTAEFYVVYEEGDFIKQSFDADKSSDVAGLSTSDGSALITPTYGEETYVHATSGYLYVPISPAVPDDEPIYVQLRIHAVKLENFGAGTGLGIYTTNSQGKQIASFINDGDLGTTGLVSADANSPAVDLIYKLNPNTDDGYDFYVKKVGADEKWITIGKNNTYNKNNALKVIRIGYNLAVSNIKTYTKAISDPENNLDEDENDPEDLSDGIKNIAFELGADSTQRNVTWLSKSNAAGVITWQKANELIDGNFTSSAKTATTTRDDWTYQYTGYEYYNNKGVLTVLEPNTKYFYQLSNGTN